MCSEGYCRCPVCVCACLCVCLLSHISPLERLFVLKILSRTQRATEVKNLWGFLLNCLVPKFWRHLLTCDILRGYCSNILRTVLTVEPSKCPKKANNRLNTTWNTTLCKAVSFFLFILRLLTKSSVYFLLHIILNSLCAFRNCSCSG